MNLFQSIENIAFIDNSEHFTLFQNVASLIHSADVGQQVEGRNCLIKIIDNWEMIPTSSKAIWEDLIEAVGFYPYISKYKMHMDDLDARIRCEYHKSPYINGKLLHKYQKKLSNLIFSRKNVIVSAPTSFGKSLLIEEIIASKIYKNIVIIQPTLALLDETRIKLKKYTQDYKIIVRTSQEASIEKGNVFLLTAERVLEYVNMPTIDLLIIDEFYKLSKQRNDNRANILNIAFLRLMKNPNCRFYLLGPNIDNVSDGFVEKYNAEFFKTDYTLVYTEEENKYDSVSIQRGGKVSESDVFSVLDQTIEQSLVFCASPSAARKLAFAYCKHLEEIGAAKNDTLLLVQWINDNLHVGWSLAHCLERKIGIHDGSMPKHITSATIKYFNDGKLKFLFCTNTIIEGVNTSAKNVIYYDDKIGTNDVDYFDYANIRGRAGRLMEHCVGKIINLKKPPEKHDMVVDIPAFTQNPIDDEVLVNIDRQEIKPFNMERFDRFNSLPEELKIIIKRNAVSIHDQLALLDVIKDMLRDPEKRENIVWGDLHDKKLYYHLQAIFELIKDRFVEGGEKNIMISTGWMASQCASYCYNKNISEMIRERIKYVAYKKADSKLRYENFDLDEFALNHSETYGQIVDKSIEEIFKFQKNWLQYKVPKWLNIIDSLQKYAAKEMGVLAGDYSYVAESIENEFMDKNLRILTEYGIPSSAISKIGKALGNRIKELSEDEVIAYILRYRWVVDQYLTQYEKEALDRCL